MRLIRNTLAVCSTHKQKSIPGHLERAERATYQEGLDALGVSRLRHEQEAAAITGKLQAFQKAPEAEPAESNAMDTRDTGTSPGAEKPPQNEPDIDKPNTGAATLPKPEGAKPITPEEIEAQKARKARLQKAANLRVEQVAADAASKKQRIGEVVSIEVDKEKEGEK